MRGYISVQDLRKRGISDIVMYYKGVTRIYKEVFMEGKRTIGFLDEFKEGGCFKAFADFVRKKPELELLFRGNSNKAIIYYHNNIVWSLSKSKDGSTACVEINYDHLRYTKNWEEKIKIFHTKYGFPLKSKENLSDKYSLGYVCSTIKKGEIFSYEFVSEMYKIIEEIMSDYFFPYLDTEDVDSNDSRLIDQFRDKAGAEQIKIMSGERRKKPNHLEKQNQQAYFSATANLKGGLFVYDLEYKEPFKNSKVKEEEKKKKNREKVNKPDCLGIRFDEEGNPISFVMVEMKSKKEAENGGSGTEEHLDGMMDDLLDPRFVKMRIEEAYEIMQGYKELELRGLSQKSVIPNLKTCLGINDTEILIVYTDELTNGRTIGHHVTASEKYGSIGYTVELFKMK